MWHYLFKLYRIFLVLVSMPFMLAKFFSRETGAEYGVGFSTKLVLCLQMLRNSKRIITASNVLEHLSMATKILNVPKSLEGSLVVCGSYKGGSTANLSLVAALCKRSLEVFDSFAGLPEPSSHDQSHILVG